ncbi:hypothetical protein FSP39_002455 [Pinctada imbricata]|uniref:CDK5 regulatory subunit-associated protein 2/Myomegalin coiled coil domain-containing protein n=1 Tax=Pinctada imbricata TaxID=66713 RepID=A0AA88XT74_PINIB|nr:hypothetical protein FSP39_002455 [Pinctada imbricata]
MDTLLNIDDISWDTSLMFSPSSESDHGLILAADEGISSASHLTTMTSDHGSSTASNTAFDIDTIWSSVFGSDAEAEATLDWDNIWESGTTASNSRSNLTSDQIIDSGISSESSLVWESGINWDSSKDDNLLKNCGLEQRWDSDLWEEELVLDDINNSYDDDIYCQKLLKSLGKKEGEVEGFKELLHKAESALQASEGAVQDLQEQLRAEKGNGGNYLKTAEVQTQDSMADQLEEMRNLNTALQKERQIIQNLTDSMNSPTRNVNGSLAAELAAMQSLRKELQEGVDRNSQMLSRLLSQQMDKQDLDASFRRELRNLLDELAMKERYNNPVISIIKTVEKKCCLHTARDVLASQQRSDSTGSREQARSPACSGKTAWSESNLDRSTLSEPQHWSPNSRKSSTPQKQLSSSFTFGELPKSRGSPSHHWSPTRGNVSPDFTIPLNRQNLSDMTAPMLRRFIRQLQQQLEDLQRENTDLRKRPSGDGSLEDVKRLKEHYENLLAEMKTETDALRKRMFSYSVDIDTLKKELSSSNGENGTLKDRLSSCYRENKILRNKLGLEDDGLINYEALPCTKDLQNELIRVKYILKTSEETREELKRQLNSGSYTDMQKNRLSGERLKTNTKESSTQTIDLNDVLKSDLKDIRKIRSSQIPRLQRPTNLPVVGQHWSMDSPQVLRKLLEEARARIQQLESKLQGTEGTVRVQTHKMKHYKALLEDNGLKSRSPSLPRSNSETDLTSEVNGGRNFDCRRVTSHNDLPTLLLKESLESSQRKEEELLKSHVESLQQLLRETKKTNAELLQKLLNRQEGDAGIVKLEKQLKESRDYAEKMEDKLRSMQDSSLHQVLGSQKDEIKMLQKRLYDTQGSCVKVENWLDELSEFLSGLAADRDNDDINVADSMKRRVQQSKLILRSLSSATDLGKGIHSASIPGSPSTNHNEHGMDENIMLKEEVNRLNEELKKKNGRIVELMISLQKKDDLSNSQRDLIGMRDRENDIREGSNGRSSSSPPSAADGNVNDACYHGDVSGHHGDLPGYHGNGIGYHGNGVGYHGIGVGYHDNGVGYHGDMLGHHGNEIDYHRDIPGCHDKVDGIHGIDVCDGGNKVGQNGDVFYHPMDASLDKELPRSRMSNSLNGHGVQYNGVNRMSTDTLMDKFLTNQEARITDHSSRSRNDLTDSMTKRITLFGRESSFPYMNFNSDDRLYGNHRMADMNELDHTITPSVNATNDRNALDGRRLFDSSRHGNETMNVSSRHGQHSFVADLNMTQEDVEQIVLKCHAMEELNKTLRDELNMYEHLCKSEGIQTSPVKDRSPSKRSGDDHGIIQQNLAELKALRLKLEKQLSYNEGLFQHLNTSKHTNHFSNGECLCSQYQARIQELQHTIDHLSKLVQEKEYLISEKIITIKEKERIIVESKSESSEKERIIVKYRMDTEEKEQEIMELRAGNAEWKIKLDEVLAEKNEEKASYERSRKDTETKITQLDRTISGLQDKLALQGQSIHQQEQKLKEQFEIIQHQVSKIASQGSTIKQKKSHIEQLNETVQQLEMKIQQQRELISQKDTHVKELTESWQVQSEKLSDMEVRLMQHVQAAAASGQRGRVSDGHSSRHSSHMTREKEVKMVKENKRFREEIRVLREQLQMNKDLNKTLHLELSVYEKLEDGENQDLGGRDDDDIVRKLLCEIKHLRVVLERCITTNTQLREKLESYLEHQTSPTPPGRVNDESRPGGYKNEFLSSLLSSPPTQQSQSNRNGVPSFSPQKNNDREDVRHGTDTQTSHKLDVSAVSIEQLRGSKVTEPRLRLASGDSSVSGPLSAASSGNDSVHPLDTDLFHNPELPELEQTISTLHDDENLETSLSSTRSGFSDTFISYHVDDKPSLLADITNQRVDTDIRTLFAIGKLDHYEKLKKECSECEIILKGMDARIQERLKALKTSAPLKSIEYSTMKQLSLTAENLRICLHESSSLIGCFWTSSLPDPEAIGTKLKAQITMMKKEKSDLEAKYQHLSQIVKESSQRLHTTNQNKVETEEYIYRHLKKTSKVLSKANSNFMEQAKKAGLDPPTKE